MSNTLLQDDAEGSFISLQPYEAADVPKGTPLDAAAKEGNIEKVRKLIDEGAVVNEGAPLDAAAREGHIDIVRLLLDNGADVNKRYPLDAAATGGNIDIVKLLLDKGADVNKWRALGAAAKGGNIDIVKLLLDNGADINKEHPLDEVASEGNIDIVKLLLDNGADVNKGNPVEAAARTGQADIVRLLLHKGADINEENPLEAAARAGQTDIVKLLLNEGADVDKGNHLRAAAGEGYIEIVKLLLDKGTDIDTGNPLKAAAKHTDVVKLLIEKGANLHKGKPLETAVTRRQTDIVRLLLDNGADVNEGKSLETAVTRRQTDIVRLLLDNRANVNKDNPIEAAVENGYTEIVELLLNKGADTNKGQSLETAVTRRQTDIVRLLLDNGANVNRGHQLQTAAGKGYKDIVGLFLDKEADINSGIALEAAARGGHTEIVRLLLDKGADANKGIALEAAAREEHIEIVRLLLDKGANVNKGYALEAAANAGNTSIVKLLLDNGADVNEGIPLNSALRKGHADVARLLLKAGADVNKGNSLEAAAPSGQIDVVRQLLDKGAWVNGGAPLKAAAKEGHTAIVSMLLDKGSDINRGCPLEIAITKGHADIVRILVDRGADVNKKVPMEATSGYDHTNVYPLETALIRGETNIVRLLLEKGADVNKGLPLKAAVGVGIETVKQLLDKGANVNKGNPLETAVTWGRTDIVRLLLAKGADVNKGNIMEAAETRGDEDIIRLLRAKGLNGNKLSQMEIPNDAVRIRYDYPVSDSDKTDRDDEWRCMIEGNGDEEIDDIEDEQNVDLRHSSDFISMPRGLGIWDRRGPGVALSPPPEKRNRRRRAVPLPNRTSLTVAGENQTLSGPPPEVPVVKLEEVKVEDGITEKLRRREEYIQGIRETTDYPCNITITVVGHKGVGKSCLVKQLNEELIPKGGPASTDTADFYIDYIAYNPETLFRKKLDQNGEIETGEHRLRLLIDRYRKVKKDETNETGRRGLSTVDYQHIQKENVNTSEENALYQTENKTKPDTAHRTETGTESEPPPQTDKQKEAEQPHQTETGYLGNSKPPRLSWKKTESVQASSPTSSLQNAVSKEHETVSLLEEEGVINEIQQANQDMFTYQKEVIDQIMKTKPKEGEDEMKGFVTIYDFGGERVFYNTHHCFMSSNMVFVLVFDVDMCLDKDRSTAGYEIVEHWLKAIATYALDDEIRDEGTPPIILIGSHLDKVSSNKITQREMFAKVLENLRANQQLRSIMEHHVLEMFPIANLNDSTVNKDVYEDMWQMIIEIAHLQSQWKKAVPARWVAMEQQLIRLKNKGDILLKYEEILDVNSKMAVPLGEEEIRDFLRYLQYAGRFLCFNVQTKHPFIVLQPQWVIDGFKQIITDDKFKTALSEEMKSDWDSYKRTGILPMDFLKQLWKEERFYTNEEELRTSMETLSLLAHPIPKDQADEVNYYIVPSILPNANPELIEHMVQDPTRVVTITLCLKFKKPYIQQAVWDKMIASCVHRFQRLDEPGHADHNFIQRGFACLKVTSRWNTVLNCKDNAMKITLFTKSEFALPNTADKYTLEKEDDNITTAGTGVQLLEILEFLLQRILELNHQSHLEYQYYLHNDYRFAADDQMVMVDELRRTPCVQSLDSKEYTWLNKDDIGVWFMQPGMEAPDATEKQNETMITAFNFPDRQLTLREIGRISAYIYGSYYPFFVHMNCRLETLEQILEENSHLDIRSRFTKVLIRLQNTKENVRFSTMTDAMQRYDMDPSKLWVILDEHRTNAFKDHRTSLQPCDAEIIARWVSVKMYFNLFLELGFSPEKIEDFDDKYYHRKSRRKVEAMLRAFIKKTKPKPTTDMVLQAMEECQMNTSDVIQALLQKRGVFSSSSRPQSEACLII